MIFDALYYNGKCCNVKKKNTYYNTIGKYKEELSQNEEYEKRKEEVMKLDWFWRDVTRYNIGEVDIEYMGELIDSIGTQEKHVVYSILNKSVCSDLNKAFRIYDTRNCIHTFDIAIKPGSPLKKAIGILNRRYKKIDKSYKLELRKETSYYKHSLWFKGKKRTFNHVSDYMYRILLFHEEGTAVKALDITNKIFEMYDTEKLIEYLEPEINNHSIRRECVDCGEIFKIDFKEMQFYRNKGFEYPRRCKKCRTIRKNNRV
jgi:hypothetical protein